MSKTGRNDPCICGSGKKYKKCCFGKKKSEIEQLENDHFIPTYDKIDYGEPILDDHFYNTTEFREYSAQRLLYSNLLMPEMEKIVSKITKHTIHRGKDERKRIEETEDIGALIEILKNNVDPVNQVLLMDKLLQKKETSLPIIFETLKGSINDSLLELAVKIIHGTGINFSAKIINIITHHQRRAYAVSQLCMLLGFFENKESEKILWDYFHFFKENYKNETYCDGPYFGLSEINVRNNENNNNGFSFLIF